MDVVDWDGGGFKPVGKFRNSYEFTHDEDFILVLIGSAD